MKTYFIKVKTLPGINLRTSDKLNENWSLEANLLHSDNFIIVGVISVWALCTCVSPPLHSKSYISECDIICLS